VPLQSGRRLGGLSSGRQLGRKRRWRLRGSCCLGRLLRGRKHCWHSRLSRCCRCCLWTSGLRGPGCRSCRPGGFGGPGRGGAPSAASFARASAGALAATWGCRCWPHCSCLCLRWGCTGGRWVLRGCRRPVGGPWCALPRHGRLTGAGRLRRLCPLLPTLLCGGRGCSGRLRVRRLLSPAVSLHPCAAVQPTAAGCLPAAAVAAAGLRGGAVEPARAPARAALAGRCRADLLLHEGTGDGYAAGPAQ
jgi:hypothetical protein